MRKATLISIVSALVTLTVACGSDPNLVSESEVGPPASPPPPILIDDDSMSGQEVGPGMMNHDQYAEGITAHLGDYQWPSSYQPYAAKIAGRAPAAMVFEAGSDQATLIYLNECGWQMAWLDAHRNGDTAAQTEAVVQMRNVIGYLQPIIDADGLAVAEEMVDKAELGDPTGIQSAVTANCIPVYWTK